MAHKNIPDWSIVEIPSPECISDICEMHGFDAMARTHLEEFCNELVTVGKIFQKWARERDVDETPIQKNRNDAARHAKSIGKALDWVRLWDHYLVARELFSSH